VTDADTHASDPLPSPTSPFEHALDAFLRDAFAAQPTWATGVGFHARDGRWPDVSQAGREGWLRALDRHRDALTELEPSRLSPDEAIDREIVLGTIEEWRFDAEMLREDAWDPLLYVRLLGNGLFSLIGREFAPWSQRGEAFLDRMQGVPAVLGTARENLLGDTGRAVSALHAETALAQLPGIAELIDTAMEHGREREAAGDGAGVTDRIAGAAADTRAALDGFRELLERDIKPLAQGEGRLGADLFRTKLRHTLSRDLDPAELLARARRDYDAVRAEMQRLAREQWGGLFPGEPPPSDPDELVRRALDRIADTHRQPDELLSWCREEVARIEAFVRDEGLVGLADEPLEITWTPTYLRAYGGAFLDSPGALEKGQSSLFWITPPGEDWSPERVESYLREDNDRMLRLLCIHEAVPGHYLQLAWANRSRSLARSVFSDGMFAEGWAVYVTQVMMDAGYGGDDPALLLVHWKFYLRSITNALIDVGIHTAGMTEEEALDLMIRGGFQEESEAVAKYLRARLTSTQLSTYYLGSLEFWDLELARRRRLAAERADESSVPEPRVVGGLPDTPGFGRREHLEAVLSHGTPPIRFVRRILLGDA
jgi:uncharacterized protein (DUF885 family)